MIPRSLYFKQLVQAQLPEYFAETYTHPLHDDHLLKNSNNSSEDNDKYSDSATNSESESESEEDQISTDESVSDVVIEDKYDEKIHFLTQKNRKPQKNANLKKKKRRNSDYQVSNSNPQYYHQSLTQNVSYSNSNGSTNDIKHQQQKQRLVDMKSTAIAKKYKCNQCGNRYKSKSSLQFHIRKIHLNDKPYECKNCGKRFVFPGHLRQHMRASHHIFDKTYKCEGCPEKFVYLRGKRAHEKNCPHFRVL